MPATRRHSDIASYPRQVVSDRQQQHTTKMAESHRLYVKGKHLSYQRSKRNNNPNCSLVKIGMCDFDCLDREKLM
jgi:hypothetical protein